MTAQTGFDDLTTLDPLEDCFLEMMDYSTLPLLPTNLVLPFEKNRALRHGAEEEYSARGVAGIREEAKAKEEVKEEVNVKDAKGKDLKGKEK